VTDDLAAQWCSVLKEPERHRMVTPTDLLAQIPRGAMLRAWRDWLWIRYAR
jgi:hypothetical protein